MSDPSSLHLLTEAAERTGLTVDALRKRIRRGKLETVKGNDGLVRVRLTTADVEALRLAEGQTGQPKSSQSNGSGQTIKALEAEAATQRERADKAEQRAERAEGESATLREQVKSERERAGRAEAEREAARIAAASAEGEARGLRLALDEARRPFWRRWLGP